MFTILISVTWTKSIAIPQISSKIGKKWRNKGSIELYCLFIAAESIVDAINFIRRIVLWSQNKFSRNLAPGRFEFLNPATSGSSQIWNTWIKSCTTLMCTTFWCNNILNAWINDVSECDSCDNFVITDRHFLCKLILCWCYSRFIYTNDMSCVIKLWHFSYYSCIA